MVYACCLHADGTEQVEGLLLLGVWGGGLVEGRPLGPGIGTAAGVADDVAQMLEQGAEGMDGRAVVEAPGVDLLHGSLGALGGGHRIA